MRIDLRKKLKLCRQSDFETITDWITIMRDIPTCEPQEESNLWLVYPIDFFDALDDRSYSEFKAQLPTIDVNNTFCRMWSLGCSNVLQWLLA